MAIDILYTQRKVIEPIYLLDAAIELAFVLAWVGLSQLFIKLRQARSM